ncbi:hypothetical protein [Streptomyces sp. NPDC058623]|uniref:hypothetical protein n=1 Tax=Streptomyces sp. NPDC058623 TaxID=3346563 RepID=UPI003649DFAA
MAKKKGISWLNSINGQVIEIGQMVVPGTPRDSPTPREQSQTPVVHPADGG